MARKLNH